ncbi:MAG: CDF family Co(II)/Ni(II) efflux transporter DmeF [Rubrivivax sp.]
MSTAPGHHHHDGHTHAHDTDEPLVQPVASQLPSSSERRTRLVALVTATAMVVEIAAGWWFNSMALLADGWHMGTHAAAIGLSALAYALARRYRTDPRFAFGTWKIEVLAGFVSALALLAVAAGMVGASVDHLLDPQPIRYLEALVVTVLGLGINVVCVFLLGPEHGHSQGHSHGHEAVYGHPAQGHAHDDLNIRSAYLHVLADAATSALAIVALVGGLWWGWAWLDPATGLVGAAMVARWSWGLIRETARSLLDCEMDHPYAVELTQAVRTQAPWSEHVDVLELRVWRIGGASFALALKLRTRVPWVGPERVHRFLAGFERVKTATVEVVQDGPKTSHKVDGSVNA